MRVLNVVSPLAGRNIYESKSCYGFLVRAENADNFHSLLMGYLLLVPKSCAK